MGTESQAPHRSGTDAGQQRRESPLDAQLACNRDGAVSGTPPPTPTSRPPQAGPAALTLGNVLHVRLVGEDVLQPLHQQQSLVVALDTVLPTVEHLVQGGRLHLLERGQGVSPGVDTRCGLPGPCGDLNRLVRPWATTPDGPASLGRAPLGRHGL